MSKLTDRQRRFIEEYPVDLNATQAAIRVGYSEKTARSQGQRLLTNADIRQVIEATEAERLERIGVRAGRVLEELAKLGFSNMLDYLKISGDSDPYVDLSDTLASLPRQTSTSTLETGLGKRCVALRRTLWRASVNLRGCGLVWC